MGAICALGASTGIFSAVAELTVATRMVQHGSHLLGKKWTSPLEIVMFTRKGPGTAAMATRELGGTKPCPRFAAGCLLTPGRIVGVVDSSLKVYGTTNLRVVDASIIPIQIACHTQATVYAIAEKVRVTDSFCRSR